MPSMFGQRDTYPFRHLFPFMEEEDDDPFGILSHHRELMQSRMRAMQNRRQNKIEQKAGDDDPGRVVDGQIIDKEEVPEESGLGRTPRTDALDRALDTAPPGILDLRARRDARRAARENFYGKYPTASERRAARARGESPRADVSGITSAPSAPAQPVYEGPANTTRRVGNDVLGPGQQYGGGTPKQVAPSEGMALAADAAYKAGFRGDALVKAIAVAMPESGGNPRAHNPNAAAGDDSYGLWQINMLGEMGPERRAKYGLKSNEELFDPYVNAKIAFDMSQGGKNWGPWTTAKSGKDQAYLEQARAAAAAVEGGGGSGSTPSFSGEFLTGPQQSQLKTLVEAAKGDKPTLEALKQSYPEAGAFIDAVSSGAGAEFVPNEKWLQGQPLATQEAWSAYAAWRADKTADKASGTEIMKAIEAEYGPEIAAAVRNRAYIDYPASRR